MGYRQYIMSLSKDEVSKLRTMTVEEIEKKFGESDDEESTYINLHRILHTRVFELGKYFDSETYQKMCKEPLLTNPELIERFEEYDPHILHEDALLTLVNHFEDNVKRYFDELVGLPYNSKVNMLDEQQKILEDPRALKRMGEYVLSQRRIWNFHEGIINKDKDDTSLTDSWEYQHEVFNVLNIYKTFDYKNNYLIVYGY